MSDERPVTNKALQLELQAMVANQRAEHLKTRLWLVGAVAASGLLNNVHLPAEVSVPTSAAVLAAIGAKLLVFR